MLSTLMTQMTAQLSTSYSVAMSAEDLGAAVAFYAGPTGSKLVKATPLLATGGDVRQVLDPSELAAFAAFARSPAGQKIEALKVQQTRDLSAAVGRALVAAQPGIEEAVMKAAQTYMATHRR